MYFNLFLDNTARLLVPRNCDRSVFRKVLPNVHSISCGPGSFRHTSLSVAVALHDEDLLGLLLAYSASHQARLLGHLSPTGRMPNGRQGPFQTFGKP